MSSSLELKKMNTVYHLLKRDIEVLYLNTSRPDIMLSVCLCGRHHSSPKETHLKAVNALAI